jgi:hypothetical protein
VTVLAVEGCLAIVELRRMDRDREQANLAAILERTAEHNWHIIENEERRLVVEETRRLSVSGCSEAVKKQYWAARAVHLSHVLLLHQVWELNGRKELSHGLDGWNNFASAVGRELLNAQARPKGTPSDWAAYDLWMALQYDEVQPAEFVTWLEKRGLLQSDRRGRQ